MTNHHSELIEWAAQAEDSSGRFVYTVSEVLTACASAEDANGFRLSLTRAHEIASLFGDARAQAVDERRRQDAVAAVQETGSGPGSRPMPALREGGI